MGNNIKRCPFCNAENIENAAFCANCGQKFDQFEDVQTNGQHFSEQEVVIEEPVALTNEVPFDSEGVNEAEFRAYIGKNQDKFIPAFRRFCKGGKVSFSPLVFLLAYLVSPIAAAFWFFHRKINKIGAIVLALGVALNIASGVLGVCMAKEIAVETKDIIASSRYSNTSYYDYDDYDDYYDDYDDYDDYDEYYEIPEKSMLEVMGIVSKVMLKYETFTMILNVLNAGFAVILGLFAKYFYFKDCANKILEIKRENPTPSSFMQISLAGGTKTSTWVTCLIIYAILMTIFTVGLYLYVLGILIGPLVF